MIKLVKTLDLRDEVQDKWFKNHIAKIKQNEDLTIINWENKNREPDYNIRYVLDGVYLFITSQMENIIIEFPEKTELNTIDKYSLNDFYKLVSFREDKSFVFDSYTARKNINNYINEENLDENTEKFLLDLVHYSYSCNDLYEWSNKIIELKKFYMIEIDDYIWLHNSGNNYCMSVISYWIGLKMIYRQVSILESLRH